MAKDTKHMKCVNTPCLYSEWKKTNKKEYFKEQLECFVRFTRDNLLPKIGIRIWNVLYRI